MPDLKIMMNGRLLEPANKPMHINGEPYVPLRFMCEQQDAQINWDSTTKQASVQKNGKVMQPKLTLREGAAYVRPSFLRDMFGLETDYIQDYNVIVLSDNGQHYTKSQVLELLPRYDGYSHEDLYWLSKIVEAEACGEPYDSKLGVANVILNRLSYNAYPDTIKAVIFDNKNGVQFTPTANGAVYNNPSDESILAAIEALEGKNNAGDTLFFLNPRLATSKWVQDNRQYAFSIGGHSYFY